MVQRLRADPGSLGLVGANGGFLSTHAVGVYSTTPKPWRGCDSRPLQARVDAEPAPPFTLEPEGWGRVETYTVLHHKGRPTDVIVVGRLDGSGERFVANSVEGDDAALRAFRETDGLDRPVCVRWHKGVNRFALSEEALDRRIPKPPRTLLPSYEHVLVERRGPVLEVVINRQEVNNALTPEGNDELEQIFDAFDADDSLWVAIIAGSGVRAFCTGNDLKASATGRRNWMPRTGFGGTHLPARSGQAGDRRRQRLRHGRRLRDRACLRSAGRRRDGAIRPQRGAGRAAGRGGRLATPDPADPAQAGHGDDPDRPAAPAPGKARSGASSTALSRPAPRWRRRAGWPTRFWSVRRTPSGCRWNC